MTPEARDAAMTEASKAPLLLHDSSGERVYFGKQLPSANNFAVLVEDANGQGYTLYPIREWYDFTKRLNFRTLSIDEAEERLRELKRKSLTAVMTINRQMAVNKQVAEAAVADAKKAILNKEIDDMEHMDAAGGAGVADEDGEGNMDYSFEWSDDDESAAVMVLATEENKFLEKKSGVNADEEGLENPLQKRVLTQEEKLEKRLKKLQEEYDEIEKKEQEAKAALESSNNNADDVKLGAKRERVEGEEPVAPGEAKKKKNKTASESVAAVSTRELNEEEVIKALRDDPMMTLNKLINLFKHTWASDLDKRSKFMKIVAKVAVSKKVQGNKVLKLREAGDEEAKK